MMKLIAVVNRLGGRLLITPELYRRGQYVLWEETEEDPMEEVEEEEGVEVKPDEWPKPSGAGWWKLSNGENVRGEEEAKRQQSLLKGN